VAVYGIEARDLRLVLFKRFQEACVRGDAEDESGNKHQSDTFFGVDVIDIRILASESSDGLPAKKNMSVRQCRWMTRKESSQQR
jgi:hypothetical protein